MGWKSKWHRLELMWQHGCLRWLCGNKGAGRSRGHGRWSSRWTMWDRARLRLQEDEGGRWAGWTWGDEQGTAKAKNSFLYSIASFAVDSQFTLGFQKLLVQQTGILCVKSTPESPLSWLYNIGVQVKFRGNNNSQPFLWGQLQSYPRGSSRCLLVPNT